MSPPPPTSTLFPYTTLFRSLHDGADRNIDNGTFETKPGRQYGDKKPGVKGISKNLEKAVECYQTGPVLDRKSTRLNSSHVAISYAVFCLKKKKNNRKGVRGE